MKVYTGFKNEWDFSKVYEKALIIDPSLKPFIGEVAKIKPMTPKEMEVNFNDKNKILNSLLPKIVNYAIDMYNVNYGNIELGECINILYCDLHDFIYNGKSHNINTFRVNISNVLRRNADRELESSKDYPLNEIADKYYYCLEEYVERKYMVEDIKKYFFNVDSILTERESKVLSLIFGLNDYERHTLYEVSKEFNVSVERIRQIEAKALRKLRHPSNNRLIRDYYICHSYDIKDNKEDILSIKDKKSEEFEALKGDYIKSHIDQITESDLNVSKEIYNSYEKQYFGTDWVLISNKKEFARKYKHLFFGAFFGFDSGVQCNDEDITKGVVVGFLDHITANISDINLPKNTKDKFCQLFGLDCINNSCDSIPIKEILILDYLGDMLSNSQKFTNRELTATDIRIFYRKVFENIDL